MKKYLVFIAFIISNINIVFAQPSITKTVSLPREKDPLHFENIKLLNNGNTAYLKYDGSGGIGIRIYDKEHNVIAQNLISSKYWKTHTVKNTSIRGVLAIKNDLVILFQQPRSGHPVLYRLVIDGNSANLKSEDMLGITKYKASYSQTSKKRFKRLESNCTFLISNNTNSGSYAIAYYDNLKTKGEDNILIQLYDNEHRLLNAAHINTKEFDRTLTQDIITVGDSCAYLVTKGYYKDNNLKPLLLLSKISNSKNGCETKKLDLSEYGNMHIWIAFLKYNPGNSKLQLLVTGEISHNSKKGVETTIEGNVLCYISPESLVVNNLIGIDNTKINEAAKTTGQNVNYGGGVHYMDVNNKNETILLKESVDIRMYTYYTKGGSYTKTYYDLGAIGVSILNTSGEEISSYFLNRTKYTTMFGYDSHFLRDIKQKIWAPKTFDFLEDYTNADLVGFNFASGIKNNYVFYNDYKKKIDGDAITLTKKDKKNRNYNALVYSLRNNNFSKDYLVGEPTGKNNKVMIPFAFDSNDAEMVTLINSKEGRKKTTDIVWMKLD